jgi:DNA-binding response OmpR family regulator
MFIHEILNGHYNIAEAVDGKQGFDLACERIPDLVVADIMMEPVDGIEFCQNLKQDERTSHIPVIMLTAMTGAEVKISSLETGADDYLTKPFKQDEFLIRIRNLIEQRKRLRILFSSGLKLEPGTISVTSTDERFLQKLIKIVEENIDNPDLDVEFMIQNIAMSRSQLHRKIKALTNESVTGFIRIIRIKRAAQLFEQKFGNVSDVMYAVGFNNLSYFTKCFKEVYNMTPTDFMAH